MAHDAWSWNWQDHLRTFERRSYRQRQAVASIWALNTAFYGTEFLSSLVTRDAFASVWGVGLVGVLVMAFNFLRLVGDAQAAERRGIDEGIARQAEYEGRRERLIERTHG